MHQWQAHHPCQHDSELSGQSETLNYRLAFPPCWVITVFALPKQENRGNTKERKLQTNFSNPLETFIEYHLG